MAVLPTFVELNITIILEWFTGESQEIISGRKDLTVMQKLHRLTLPLDLHTSSMGSGDHDELRHCEDIISLGVYP